MQCPPSPAVEQAAVRLYYAARKDESLREEFLATLPFAYTSASSELMEEFLIYNLGTIEGWLGNLMNKPFLWNNKSFTQSPTLSEKPR